MYAMKNVRNKTGGDRMANQANMAEVQYSKQQILSSKQWSPVERDCLQALLQADRQYSRQQVKQILDVFMKEEVE